MWYTVSAACSIRAPHPALRRVLPRCFKTPTVLFAPTRAPSEDDLQRFAEELGVKATDEYTVQFQLIQPTSAFPTIVGAWLGRVVPRENIEARGVNWTDLGEMWTSGPYVLIDREPFRFLLFEKNPLYFDADNVILNACAFAYCPMLLRRWMPTCVANWIPPTPMTVSKAPILNVLTADPALAHDLKLLPGLCTTYIGFNTSKPPFDNVQVRQAFALALNRTDVVTQVFKLGESARWFTPPQVNAAPDADADIGLISTPRLPRPPSTNRVCACPRWSLAPIPINSLLTRQ